MTDPNINKTPKSNSDAFKFLIAPVLILLLAGSNRPWWVEHLTSEWWPVKAKVDTVYFPGSSPPPQIVYKQRLSKQATLDLFNQEINDTLAYDRYAIHVDDVNGDNLWDVICVGPQNVYVHFGLDKNNLTPMKNRLESKLEKKTNKTLYYSPPGWQVYFKDYDNDLVVDLVFVSAESRYVHRGSKSGVFSDHNSKETIPVDANYYDKPR